MVRLPTYLRFLSCFARYVSQIRLIIARRTLRFAEINLFSWGPFHRGVIGDLNTWHLFLQSGVLRKRNDAFASSNYNHICFDGHRTALHPDNLASRQQ
jgi:hypothetical protein